MEEATKKIKHVTIIVKREFEDGTAHELARTYANTHITWRRGLCRYKDHHGYVDYIVPNGQEVMKIVAWKGCDNPDSFVANESVITTVN